MAASTLSLSLSLNTLLSELHQSRPLRFAFSPPISPKRRRLFSTPCSSSSPPAAIDGVPPRLSFASNLLRSGRFLGIEELEKLGVLESFEYSEELKSGSLSIRAMRDDLVDPTVALLAESFSEAMLLPAAYSSVLRFLVKNYLVERRDVIPYAITILGFFRGRSEGGELEEEEELAGTVEVCFDQRGVNASPPTPTAPRNSPYISNMTVKREFRRRGIGWRLLKASEELISKMTSANEVYLHCRMIDAVPFNMYRKAGYDVVKTDTVLVLVMLQRRKHLMCKKLPVATSSLESEVSEAEEGETEFKVSEAEEGER